MGSERPLASSDGNSSTLVTSLELTSFSIATATVCLLPWILGGAIPQARIVLQLAALIAALASLIAHLLDRKNTIWLPGFALPALGLALVGIIQLLPAEVEPASHMQHAVRAELIPEIPAVQQPQNRFVPRTGSLMPAETRYALSQWLSLALLAGSVHQSCSTKRRLIAALIAIAASGVAMVVVAMTQQFGGTDVVLFNSWKVHAGRPYGCFVNPNNAAAWLLIPLAASLTLTTMSFQSASKDRTARPGMLTSRGDRMWFASQQLLQRMGSLSIPQVLAALMTVLIVFGIVATLSRSGILALAVGLTVFFAASGNVWKVVTGLVLIIVPIPFAVSLFDLDLSVQTEIASLNDPSTQAAVRLRHWQDTMPVVADFPLLGTGLGSYRYANLPYQRKYTANWFQRADNQYLETLVESGVCGLILYLATGLLMLNVARVGLRRSTASKKTESRFLPRTLSRSLLMLVAALSVNAVFDYATSLDSIVTGLFVFAALTSRMTQLADSDKSSRSSPANSPGRFAGAGLAIRIALLVSSGLLLPDTVAACRCYAALVPLERILDGANPELLSSRGDEFLQSAEAAVAARASDLDGYRIINRFRQTMFRNQLIAVIAGDQKISNRQLQTSLRAFSTFEIVHRLLSGQFDEGIRQSLKAEIERSLEKYPWHTEADEVLLRSPCMPGVAADRFILSLAIPSSDTALANTAVEAHLQFAQPTLSSSFARIGQLLTFVNRSHDADQYWKLSLVGSELYRPDILRNATIHFGAAEALRRFPPDTFESHVLAAENISPDTELQTSLLESCERLWASSDLAVTQNVAVLRGRQLLAAKRSDEAFDWIDSQLQLHPNWDDLRRFRARQLEIIGRYADSYDEWLRITELDEPDEESKEAMERLNKLPPTRAKVPGN